VNLNVVKNSDGTYHVRTSCCSDWHRNVTEATLAALLDRLGATLIDAYAPLGIVRLRLPHGSDVPAIAETLANTPGIQAAEPDYAYPLEGGGPATGETGSPSPHLLSPHLQAHDRRSDGQRLACHYEDSPFVQSAYDAVSPGAEVGDELGHGTQMTLIAAGAVNPMGATADDTHRQPGGCHPCI
jgi:hypothetical protein